jgi:uncharacterized membrane protein YkvA (DUF1232 family)
MALPGGLNLAQAIAGVCANDVDAVRAELPGKFAAVRPLLMGGRLRRVRDLARDVRTLFDILTDRSFSVPWRTTAAIVFALGYFVLSLDIIPDAIPVLGFLDDALVVAEVVLLLSGDLRRYREHRARRAADVVGQDVFPATDGEDLVEDPPADERLVA